VETKFPELRPPLNRDEPAPLRNECHCPSLIAEWKFDERFPNEPELRPDSNPRFPRLMPRDALNPPYELLPAP
jgi:hypothetical protein